MSWLRAEIFPQDKSQTEIILALLVREGLDWFEEKEDGLIVFAEEKNFTKSRLREILEELKIKFPFSFSVSEVKDENWNEQWEKSFQPVTIANSIAIRASFHPPMNFPVEIIVDPKMAFGTGHHVTTRMMLENMLRENFRDKKVFDFGAGTGILSIAAEKMGAGKITALENDPVAAENCQANCLLNGCENISAVCGGIELIQPKEKFDVILANINLNTILDSMKALKNLLAENGIILFSGILTGDLEKIELSFSENDLQTIRSTESEGWLYLTVKRK